MNRAQLTDLACKFSLLPGALPILGQALVARHVVRINLYKNETGKKTYEVFENRF